MNYNKKYLSKRPFLIINLVYKPGPGARTHVKNWAETSGWEVSEELSIVDRVTNRHNTYSTLIIDILEARVVKNTFENATNEEAMAHYLEKYKPQITQAVSYWAEKEAHKKAVEDLADEAQ